MDHWPKSFLQRIDIRGPDECWPWRGWADVYGKVYHAGRAYYAHRLAYELAKGPVPAGMIVRHRCDNPKCVNPRHLLVGTYLDNSADALERDRLVRGSRHGRARLNEAAVRYIRRARASGATYKELGKRFGCHLSSIHYAAKLGWQHVTHEAG